MPGKLELYATGFRNSYDLLWHGNGGLYTNENEGNAGFGLTPGAGDEPCMGTPFDPGTPPDELFRDPGRRLPRPPGAGPRRVPVRGRRRPDRHVRVELVHHRHRRVHLGASSAARCSGDILSTNYAVGDTLTRVTLGPGGTSVAQKQTLASGLSDPLDVLVHPDGTIFLAEHGGFPGKISVLRPIPSSSEGACPALGPLADSDGDGYADQDELDNATGRCNPAASPPDADGDRTSDRNDPDDDNDGTPDATDPLGPGPDERRRNPAALPGRLRRQRRGRVLRQRLPGRAALLQWRRRPRGPDRRRRRRRASCRSGPPRAPPRATANTQQNALQQGFATAGPFTVEAAIGEPFQSGQPQAGEAGGIFLGPGEDDYVRLAVNANGGNPIVELGVEQGGTFTRHAASPALPLPASSVRLYLDADRAAGTVTARYRVGAGSTQTIATVPVPASFLASPARAGVMTTMSGSPKSDVPFVYEDFAVTSAAPAAAPTTAATLTATHPGRTISTASSYTAGTFTLKNTSTGGEDIAGFSIDLASGPAMWPDIVFDPEDGTPAGDTVGKSFTVDTGTTSGVSATGGHAAPNGDGFSVLDVDTGGFDPGDTLKFSIDIDPTSIRGVSGTPTPPAGGIGGAEMHGATLTVRFSDGSVRTTDISITPGSVTDGRATASAARPVEPGLARLSGEQPGGRVAGLPDRGGLGARRRVRGRGGGRGPHERQGRPRRRLRHRPVGGQHRGQAHPGAVHDRLGRHGERADHPDRDGRLGRPRHRPELRHRPPGERRRARPGVRPDRAQAGLVAGRHDRPDPDRPPALAGRDRASRRPRTWSRPSARRWRPGSITASSFRLAPSAGGPAVAASIAASCREHDLHAEPERRPGAGHRSTPPRSPRPPRTPPATTWRASRPGRSPPPPAGGGGEGAVTFAGGLAVVEAEDHDAKVARGGKDWVAGQSPSGSVGAALKAAPDTGGAHHRLDPDDQPRARLPRALPRGRHLPALAAALRHQQRQHAPRRPGRGRHRAERLAWQTGAWRWAKATVSVPSAGEHTVQRVDARGRHAAWTGCC